MPVELRPLSGVTMSARSLTVSEMKLPVFSSRRRAEVWGYLR